MKCKPHRSCATFMYQLIEYLVGKDTSECSVAGATGIIVSGACLIETTTFTYQASVPTSSTIFLASYFSSTTARSHDLSVDAIVSMTFHSSRKVLVHGASNLALTSGQLLQEHSTSIFLQVLGKYYREFVLLELQIHNRESATIDTFSSIPYRSILFTIATV